MKRKFPEGRITWMRELLFNELGKRECEECGKKDNLHFHHRDGNFKNNYLKNIQILCSNCHMKKHALGRSKFLQIVWTKQKLGVAIQNAQELRARLKQKWVEQKAKVKAEVVEHV